jgi:hypothetical protein
LLLDEAPDEHDDGRDVSHIFGDKDRRAHVNLQEGIVQAARFIEFEPDWVNGTPATLS